MVAEPSDRYHDTASQSRLSASHAILAVAAAIVRQPLGLDLIDRFFLNWLLDTGALNGDNWSIQELQRHIRTG